MYTKRGTEDWFILNDFDLAVTIGEDGKSPGATAHHRIGTLPLMATELLKDLAEQGADFPQHSFQYCVRLDYESLLYVAVWCAIKVRPTAQNEEEEAAEAAGNDYLRTWEQGDYAAMSLSKTGFFGIPLKKLPLSPIFFPEIFLPWLAKIKWPFINRQSTYSSRVFDAEVQGDLVLVPSFEEFETGYGEVTLEKFSPLWE